MNTPTPSSSPDFPALPTLTAESDDGLLLTEIARQNVQAIDCFYERYAPALYSFIVRIVKNETVAEGLVQETFLKVWQNADTFNGTGVVAAWLFRIARNLSLDQLRRTRVRPVPAEKELELHYDLSEQSPTDYLTAIETEVEQSYHRHYIHIALEEIPEEQRDCLVLAYYQGMSQREIAKHTDIPLGTIKTRIRMGLKKLERLLRRYGYTRATV